MRAAIVMVLVAACGPSSPDDATGDCAPGTTGACYAGVSGTDGVGPCHGGTRTCMADRTWGACNGSVVPVGESCGDGIDNNCNGAVDENVDADGDGITTCEGDCCDSTECNDPALVNSGAFDSAGNGVDDDCDGQVDNGDAACDTGLASNTTTAMDFARAIELCQTATLSDKRWGVLDAKLSLADGSGTPALKAHAIRPGFGTNMKPHAGASFALLSTGAAAGKNDTNPAYQDFQATPTMSGNNTQSVFPSDFFALNGNALPNTPGCPAPQGTDALDPIMLTLTVRVPTNAKSFTLDTGFYSSEFPEFVCSPFNDFFVVLLDSTYAGTPANPTDKNLAFYTPPGTVTKYPIGVNLAFGNTGLFAQCVNGATGCGPMSTAGQTSACTGTDLLVNTGLDTPNAGKCNSNSLQGGGTGWLKVTGNVTPGEVMTLRIAIWDTSDHILDSIAVIDAFKWSLDVAQPGTVIF